MDAPLASDWLIAHRRELLTAAMFLSFFGFGLAETWLPRRRIGSEFDARWLSHAGILVCNIALIELTIGEASLRASDDRAGLLPISAVLGDDPWLAIIGGVLVADLLRYGIHRINHAVPWLWRLHALHHSDPAPDVTTTFRHHPIEHLLLTATVWVAHLVFGASAASLVVYGVISVLMSPLQHANLRLPRGLQIAMGWVVVTNALHLSHHSTDRRDGNANFAIMFSFWDRMFGTYRAPTAVLDGSVRYGVDEIPQASCNSFRRMLTLPWRAWRA